MDEANPRVSKSSEPGLAGRIIASAIGGAAAGSISGPPGALVGAAGGATTPLVLAAANKLAKAGGDVLCRVMSGNEADRVRITLKLAAAEIERRDAAGEVPRADLFESPYGNAEELFEGTLLKARTVYEAAKLRHLSTFMVSVLFDDAADIQASFYLLNLAERLTYQQYVLLSVLDKRNFGQSLGADPFGLPPRPEMIELLLPLRDLFALGLLQEESEQVRPLGGLASRIDGDNVCYSKPDDIRLSQVGEIMADRLGLHTVSDDVREKIAERLRT